MTPDFLNSFEFFTGVPDSQLKALCDWLLDKYGCDPSHHIIAANEGNATAIGAGYYLATGKAPVVYMQNSGIGNALNPIASLLNEQVYGLPCLFIVGWRGEPGTHDEPQHIFQGKITLPLFNDLQIQTFVLDKGTSEEELAIFMKRLPDIFAEGKSAALIIAKGVLNYDKKTSHTNTYSIVREEAIRKITEVAGDAPIISTTGKTSRELYEIRVATGKNHEHDFLTVGSMGHSSSIALGIAINHPEKTVWCIDGDGAALMHLGALAVIGASGPQNLVHVVINNNAHESVGGQPTVANKIDLPAIARACCYKTVISVDAISKLCSALERIKDSEGPIFFEIKCAMGSRANLGRPVHSPCENKIGFMHALQSKPMG